MSRVSVGLIGASKFARRHHYPFLRAFDDVEIVAIAEPVAELREQAAADFEVPKQFPTHREMLDKISVDAVYAVMAPHRSYDVAFECISQKVPIFLEKPAAMDTAEAERLAEAAAKSGALTMVAFNRRFIPVLRKAREEVLSRGAISHCVATYYKHRPDVDYFDNAMSYVRSDAIHSIDTLRWIGGEVAKVTSLSAAHHHDRVNATHALLLFESGATGVLITDFATARRFHTYEMHTLGCSAFVDPNERALIHQPDVEQPIVIDAAEIAGSTDNRVGYGFEAENRHFIDCVKANRRPDTHLAEAARTHALVDEILRCSISP